MSVGLYMDVHIPASVTCGLLLRNVDVLTAQLDGSAELDDAALLDRATALNRVLVSQDADLLAEATRRQRNHIPFAGVFYVHQLDITIGQFISDLEILAALGEPEEYRHRVEYLPL